MNECTKCKNKKTLDEFNFKNKKLGIRHRQCRSCTRLLIKDHYSKNREYYLSKTLVRNSAIKSEINIFMRDYLLKNPCIDCGESDITVLEFDHKGEVPKLMAVSSLVRARYSLKKVRDEVDKCEVRCANCHRRKTARDFKWFKGKMPL